MSADVDKIEIPEDAILFSRSYYNIGAVAEMFKVNQSLIRYWENEFSILKPKKNGKGDRLFRPEDIKNLKLIHHLLRERKYTIEGAKDFLKKSKYADKKFEMIESLKSLKSFLHELKAGI
ncbi:MAG: MerR family transcriptional regulator [Ferruginibacter sp.]|nr:MerR family transcriptional regulator [Ferruginibacter sp.]